MIKPPPLPLTWGRTWRRRYHLWQIEELKTFLAKALTILAAETLPPDAADPDLPPPRFQVEVLLRITPLPPPTLGRSGEVNNAYEPDPRD